MRLMVLVVSLTLLSTASFAGGRFGGRGGCRGGHCGGGSYGGCGYGGCQSGYCGGYGYNACAGNACQFGYYQVPPASSEFTQGQAALPPYAIRIILRGVPDGAQIFLNDEKVKDQAGNGDREFYNTSLRADDKAKYYYEVVVKSHDKTYHGRVNVRAGETQQLLFSDLRASSISQGGAGE